MGTAPLDSSPRELHALRAWYLLYFAGQYVQNFLPLLFAQTMAFNPSQIGSLVGLRRLITLLFAPVFTLICDYTHLHRPLLTVALTLYYIMCIVLSMQRSLLSTALVLSMREICSAGADATVNSAAVATLAKMSGPATYGALRLYGSLGWGTMSFLGAVALDAFFRSDMRYVLYSQAIIGLFVIFLVARVLNLSPVLFATAAERRRAAATIAIRDESDRIVVCGAEWAAKVMMFAANVLMVGFSAGMLQTSLFLYCSSLAVPNGVLGLAVMLNCAVEAVCFWFHGDVCSTLGGPDTVFRLAVLINAANVFGLSAIQRAPNPALAYVACMTVGGMAFPLFWASAVQICSRLAPPGKETSAQGALSALNWGFGAALGSVVAGAGMMTVGTPKMYLCVCAVQISVLVLPLAIMHSIKTLNRRSEYREIESSDHKPYKTAV